MQFIEKNTFFLFLKFFTTILLGALQLKVLSCSLSEFELGLFLASLSFGAIVSVFLLAGLPTVILRFIPKFEATHALDRAAGLCLFSLGFFIILGSGVFGILSFFSPLLAKYLFKNPSSTVVLQLSFIFILINSLLLLIYAIFHSFRQMELSAVFSTSGMALFTIFLYLNRASLTAQRAFKIGIFCYLFLFISALGLFFFYFLRKTRRISFRGLLREIIPYWKGALPASIIPYFFGYGDRVIVSAMASASAVGFFHIPARILEYVKRLMAIPSEAALPEITHQWELRLRDTLGKDLEFFEKMYFIMGCAATILVILFRRELILLVSNPQFLKTEAILIIMALSLPPLSLIHPVTITARAIGKIRIGVISSLILVTVYLLSGGIFLAFGVGIMGMALAQCLAGVVGGSYIFIISRRFASLRWKVLKLFPIFLISVISFTISYLTKFLPFIPYFIKMFLCLVFCLLIFNFGIIKLKILSNKDIQNLKLIFKIPLTQRILQIFLNWPEKLFKKEPHLNF